jgi:threonine aldolase
MKIDLRSDTVTRPSKGMYNAMITAQIGDDVFGEDPTVIALENKIARILGKESAIFVPSGTMANQIAVKANSTSPGELICEQNSHVYLYEGGGLAFNSGLSVKLLQGNRGRINKNDLLNAINPTTDYFPESQVLSLENTHNRGGGSIYSLDTVKEIHDEIGGSAIKMHLDGARLFNAVAESDYSAAEFCAFFDTVSVCLSKGLGAPVGSVLAASSGTIQVARRLRKVMGGGMRQAGILAAAGIYALDNNLNRLKEDHKHAKIIEQCLSDLPVVENVIPVETNIIVAELNTNCNVDDFIKSLSESDILAVPFGVNTFRMVTHLDVTSDMISTVCDKMETIKF